MKSLKRISIARLPYFQMKCPPRIVDSNRDLAMDHLIQTCLKHSLIPSPSLAELFRKKLDKYNHIGLIYNCYYPSNVSGENSGELQFMHLKFITNYFFFLFSVDDRIDGVVENCVEAMEKKNLLIDQLVDVLRVHRKLGDGKVESNDPHVNFLIQIMEDLHSMTGNQETIDRFVESMEGFFNIGVRGDQKNETPEAYLERRIYDSATYAMLNVLEITSSRNGVGLMGKDYDTELFSKAHKLCAIVFSLVNDLLSYHKDVVLPSGGNLLGWDSNLSYIQVLLKNNKELSLEQVTNQCLDYILESKFQFEDIMKLCADNCNEKQLEYIKGVEKLMDGMCLWMLYSNRYRHEEQVYEELTQMVTEEKF